MKYAIRSFLLTLAVHAVFVWALACQLGWHLK